MKTSNPALREDVFRTRVTDQPMTIGGVVNKCFILGLLVAAGAFWTWQKTMPAVQQAAQMGQNVIAALPSSVSTLYVIGLFGGLVIGMMTAFQPRWAPVTAPIYAVCEGIVLGGVSALFEVSYPGIVSQALAGTIGTFFVMLGVYRSGLVKVTPRFVIGILVATGGIAILYFVDIIMGVFFHSPLSFIHESTGMGIAFSILVVGLAAFNLLLDFHFIERRIEAGADQAWEWYSAFGLVVTLVWLYIEILRLLAKLRERR